MLNWNMVANLDNVDFSISGNRLNRQAIPQDTLYEDLYSAKSFTVTRGLTNIMVTATDIAGASASSVFDIAVMPAATDDRVNLQRLAIDESAFCVDLQVNIMVQAMSGFALPAAVPSEWRSNYREAVATQLAANWH